MILHGLFGLGDNWRTIARMLESEYLTILVDLRNHGRSPHDPVMNLEIMAADVMELADDLELESILVLGHSLGGKVAMQMAVQYPERIDKLIVVDIAPKVYSPHHATVMAAIEALDPGAVTSREEAETVLRRYLGSDESTVQFLMKNISRTESGGLAWKANMPGIIHAYPELMANIVHFHPYLGPVLFVKGARSGYVGEDDMPAILQIFPRASLVTVPDAGHWVHADNPAGLLQAILPFIRHT